MGKEERSQQIIHRKELLMSKMMKSRVCTLRLHDEFVNSCMLFCVFLHSWWWNSNDIFPFSSRETGNGFCTSVSQGQGRNKWK